MKVPSTRRFNGEAVSGSYRTKASPPTPCVLRADAFFDLFFSCRGDQDVMTDLLRTKLSRRTVLQAAAVGAVGISPALRSAVWAQGSDAPEKKEVKIGFIPLTDCASRSSWPRCWASTRSTASRSSRPRKPVWAGVRDKLVNGELDMAHVLYGLIYGVHLGISGPKKDMAVLMTLNNNGQAITLSKKLADKGGGRRRFAGQADGQPTSANTPSRRPSRPARTRCGCTTGWRRTASTR